MHWLAKGLNIGNNNNNEYNNESNENKINYNDFTKLKDATKMKNIHKFIKNQILY